MKYFYFLLIISISLTCNKPRETVLTYDFEKNIPLILDISNTLNVHKRYDIVPTTSTVFLGVRTELKDNNKLTLNQIDSVAILSAVLTISSQTSLNYSFLDTVNICFAKQTAGVYGSCNKIIFIEGIRDNTTKKQVMNFDITNNNMLLYTDSAKITVYGVALQTTPTGTPQDINLNLKLRTHAKPFELP